MRGSRTILIAPIIALSLVLSSCSGIPTPPSIFRDTATPRPPTRTPTSTRRPPPTRTPTRMPTRTPYGGVTHDIYAGFTGDSEIPFVALHRSGEKLATTHDPSVSPRDGVIWSPRSGDSMVIDVNSHGLPETALVADYYVFYDYTSVSSPRVTVIAPSGARIRYQAQLSPSQSRRVAERLDRPASETQGTAKLAARRNDLLDTLDYALDTFDLGACGIRSSAAAANYIEFTSFFSTVTDACLGSFIDEKIKEGEASNMDVSGWQAAGMLVNTAGCLGNNPKDCLDAIVTAAKVLRVQKVGDPNEQGPTGPPSTPKPNCTGKYCEP